MATATIQPTTKLVTRTITEEVPGEDEINLRLSKDEAQALQHLVSSVVVWRNSAPVFRAVACALSEAGVAKFPSSYKTVKYDLDDEGTHLFVVKA